jgi:hypothetical protein
MKRQAIVWEKLLVKHISDERLVSRIKNPHLGMVSHACNPSTGEVEAGASLGCTARPIKQTNNFQT